MHFKMVVVLMGKTMNPHPSRAGKLVLPLGIERKNQISISRVTHGHSWDSISLCPLARCARAHQEKSPLTPIRKLRIYELTVGNFFEKRG